MTLITSIIEHNQALNVLCMYQDWMALQTPFQSLTIDALGSDQMDDPASAQTRPIVTRKEAVANGSLRYFTGKACSRGHVDERFVSTFSCVSCMRDHRTRNVERDSKSRSRRRSERPGHFLAIEQASRQRRMQRDPEGFLKRRAVAMAKYRKTHPDIASKNSQRARKTAKYKAGKSRRQMLARQRNLEKFRALEAASIKRRRLANPLLFAAMMAARTAARRARKVQNGGNYTAADVLEIANLQKWKCAHPWCRKDLKKSRDIDHIIPLAIGGTNDRGNIQLLCPTCNRSKGPKHPIRFAQQNGFLL